jgi:gliding motility-associated protein GldC
MARTSEIKISIRLDDKQIPETIKWQATDSQTNELQESHAMMLAFWDAKEKNGMSIDLWTKELTIPEMNIFFYQTLMTHADTYERATQWKDLADDLRAFAKSFMEKVKLKEEK